MIQPVPSPKNINETNEFASYAFINGTHKTVDDVQFAFWDFVSSIYHSLYILCYSLFIGLIDLKVDVRDVALLHIIALTSPFMANKRNVISSGPLSPQLIVNAIRKNFPELDERLPRGGDQRQVFPKGLHPTPLDNARTLEIFRLTIGQDWKFRTLDESIKGSIQSLLELEKKWGSGSA